MDKPNRPALRTMFPDWTHLPFTNEFNGQVRFTKVIIGAQHAQIITHCNSCYGEFNDQ